MIERTLDLDPGSLLDALLSSHPFADGPNEVAAFVSDGWDMSITRDEIASRLSALMTSAEWQNATAEAGAARLA
jgi:hypothetical protein